MDIIINRTQFRCLVWPYFYEIIYTGSDLWMAKEECAMSGSYIQIISELTWCRSRLRFKLESF